MHKFAAWVKNWFGQWWKWITTGETTLSVAERILAMFGVNVLGSLFTGFFGWVLKNPLYGVWIFLGTFALLEAVQALRVYRLSRSGINEEAQPSGQSDGEGHAPPAPFGPPQMGGGAIVLGTDERPLVEDHDLQDKTYEHRSFWMAEFARKIAPSGDAQAIIRDRRFYDCHIYGPVVFGPLAPDEVDRVFVDCEWIEEQDVVSWLPAENHEEYVGVVRLEDCRFERCHLSRVGVLKQEEQSPVQRLDSERAENERLREQTDQLRTTAESYVDTFHKRENADHNRLALVHELRQLREEGQRLPQYDHARHDIEDWEARSSKLIEMALGVQKRRDFVQHNPEYARWSNDVDENDAEELVRMRMLLDRLRDLTRQVNSYAPYTELRSDFDVREYRKWLDIR